MKNLYYLTHLLRLVPGLSTPTVLGQAQTQRMAITEKATTADDYEWADRANCVAATRPITDAEKAPYGASVTNSPSYDASKVRPPAWQSQLLRTAFT